jgi:hypothetical protein
VIDRRPFDETPGELRARRMRAQQRRLAFVAAQMKLEASRSRRRFDRVAYERELLDDAAQQTISTDVAIETS